MTSAARSLPLDPADFAGEWSIERELADLRDGASGRFRGTLTVTPGEGGYRWCERGTLVWGAHRGPAERHLLLRRREGEWWMCFADGRPFHPWRAGGELVHPCAADTYRGVLGFDPGEPDRFELTWEITGPAKRARIVSRMRRQSAAAPTTMTPSTCTSRANRRNSAGSADSASAPVSSRGSLSV